MLPAFPLSRIDGFFDSHGWPPHFDADNPLVQRRGSCGSRFPPSDMLIKQVYRGRSNVPNPEFRYSFKFGVWGRTAGQPIHRARSELGNAHNEAHYIGSAHERGRESPVSRCSGAWGYAVLFKRRPVTALTPLRLAASHRFLAAREIFFRPAADRRPCLTVSAFADGFLLLAPFEGCAVFVE